MVYVQAKSFRLVSLTSFLLNTLERIVDVYIRDGVLQESTALPSTCMQVCRSVQTSLHSLAYKTERSLEDGLIIMRDNHPIILRYS
jgi:hypothetical protein